MRDFNEWISNFKDSIATWKYYTDFEKAYRNTDKIKDELNVLNGLIGADDIESEFRRIVNKFPAVLNVIPILIAKRENEIKITDADRNYIFNFKTLIIQLTTMSSLWIKQDCLICYKII